MKNQKNIEFVPLFIVVCFLALNFVFVFGTLFGGFEEFQAKLEIKGETKEMKNEEVSLSFSDEPLNQTDGVGSWGRSGNPEFKSEDINDNEMTELRSEETNETNERENEINNEEAKIQQSVQTVSNQFVFGAVVDMVTGFFEKMGNYLKANFLDTGVLDTGVVDESTNNVETKDGEVVNPDGGVPNPVNPTEIYGLKTANGSVNPSLVMNVFEGYKAIRLNWANTNGLFSYSYVKIQLREWQEYQGGSGYVDISSSTVSYRNKIHDFSNIDLSGNFEVDVEFYNNQGDIDDLIIINNINLGLYPPSSVSVNIYNNTNNILELVWTGVPGIVKYRIERNGEVLEPNITGDSYIDNNLEYNTQYEYRVFSVSPESTSVFSENSFDIIKNTGIGNIPLVTTSIGNQGADIGKIKIYWEEVSGTTSYKIKREYYDTSSFCVGGSQGVSMFFILTKAYAVEGCWKIDSQFGNSGILSNIVDTFYVDNNFVLNKKYRYSVQAVGPDSLSLWTTSLEEINTNELLYPPVWLSIALTNNIIRLNWQLPSVNTLLVEGHEVKRKKQCQGGGSLCFEDDFSFGVNGVTSVVNNNYDDNNFSFGTNYKYYVKTLGQNGSSSSWIENENIINTTLYPPTWRDGTDGISLTGPTSIKLGWDAPNQNSSLVKGYKIERYKNNATSAEKTYSINDKNTLAFTDNQGLMPGASYQYKILSFNGNNNSVLSGPVSLTTPPNQVPFVYSKTYPVDQNKILIGWQGISAFSGHSSVSYYLSRYTKDGSQGVYSLSSNPAIPIFGANTVSYLDSGLIPGKYYRYEIKSYLNGLYSPINSSAELIAGLVAPSQINHTFLTNGIKLSWNIVPIASNYFIEKYETSSGEPILDGSFNRTISGTIDNITDINLVAGKKYFYQIQSIKDGIRSLQERSQEFIAKPKAPTSLALINEGAGLKLTWIGTTGASYTVQRFVKQGNNFNASNPFPSITNTFYSDSNVGIGSIYKYSVTTNQNGQPSLSTMSPERMAGLTPPTGIELTSLSTGGIGISWNSIDGASSYNLVREKWVINGCVEAGTSYNNKAEKLNIFWTYLRSFVGLDNKVYGQAIGGGNQIDCFKEDGTVATTAGLSHNDTAISYGETYRYKVATTINSWTSLPGFSSGSLVAVPPKPSNFNGYLNYFNGVSLGWSEISGITNYSLFRYDNGSTISSHIYNIAGTNLSIGYGTEAGSLKRGMNYKFGLKAMGVNNVGSEMVSINMTTPPNAVTNQNAQIVSSGVQVGWGAVSNADSYKIRRSFRGVCSEEPSSLVYNLNFDKPDILDIGKDASSQTNHAVNYGVALSRDGLRNGAGVFKSSGYLMRSGTTASSAIKGLNSASGTISLWFKSDTSSSSSPQDLLHLRENNSNFLKISLKKGGTGMSSIDFNYGTGFNLSIGWTGNSWHNLVLTKGGNITRFYFDGVEARSSILNSWLNALNIKDFAVGAGLVDDSTSTRNHFTGLIDEMRIYNGEVLASDIIKGLYECGSSVRTQGANPVSFTDTYENGLLKGDKYLYEITAFKEDFGSEIKTTNLITIPPVAPSLIGASEILSGVALSWTAPYGATDYKIRRNWSDALLPTSLIEKIDFDNLEGQTSFSNIGVVSTNRGLLDRAGHFDGNSYLKKNNFDGLYTDSGTISLWFKLQSDILSPYELIRISDSEANFFRIAIVKEEDYRKVLVSLKPNAGGFSKSERASTLDNPNNLLNWYNLIISQSGTNGVSIYFDGNLLASDQSNLWLDDLPNRNTFIGTEKETGNQKFQGLMDEVRFFNTGLSPEQVKKLYDYGKYIKIDGGVSTLSYIDNYASASNPDGVIPGTLNRYSVWAVNDGGESPYAISDSITPANFRGVKGKIFYDYDGKGGYNALSGDRALSGVKYTIYKGTTQQSYTGYSNSSGDYAYDLTSAGSGTFYIEILPKVLDGNGNPMTSIENNLYTEKGKVLTSIFFDPNSENPIVIKNIGIASLNADRTYGQTNTNASISLADLNVIIAPSYYNQATSSASGFNFLDLNYDGKVDLADLNTIINPKYYNKTFNLNTSIPVEDELQSSDGKQDSGILEEEKGLIETIVDFLGEIF